MKDEGSKLKKVIVCCSILPACECIGTSVQPYTAPREERNDRVGIDRAIPRKENGVERKRGRKRKGRAVQKVFSRLKSTC